ncbi:hypothetical protein A2957_01075 [Candidatus Roizmanbacteria bacterium RIFCSPLOWO2_01_FULL_38_11]|uniref:Type IV secretion system coupling protein TraD DNA-binding domain-containing protein n=1 Tax=Candidatus Roizmanbacteria bacterium RIFCSPLOWO2_01_FULL_38_11 TaxID=1802060 RepID=A0A1F7INP3_9BACT|nr:MAG: hypothetical protein A2957_01075 [Candidatus Roizmanbacteria bacterium RIFCSPLOWO2_01_FULL_38_11]
MSQVILFIKTPPSNTRKEDAMENFFHALQRVLPNNTPLSIEMASSQQFLRFYIVIPQQYKGLIESQLYAQYPEAEIEQVHDYLPRSFQNTALAQIDFRPTSLNMLTTYRDMQENFIKLLSAILSKSDPDDRAFFQISLKRVGSKLFDRGITGAYIGIVNKQSPNREMSKFSQDLFLGKLRIAFVSKSSISARQKLDVLVNLLKSVKSSTVELKKRTYLIPGNLEKMFTSRTFSQGDYWSVSELATLFHLPYEGGLVSNVVQTTSKKAPAPDILPTYGNVDNKSVSFIGYTNYRNDKKIFGIKRIDRRRHVYVIGKTGNGKSRFIELLLISDIQNGEGCCLLDPHGDLATDLLHFIPKNRINDVVYINPTDQNFPIGFNPLEPVSDYESRQQLSSLFIAIFKKLFLATWTPQMEHLIRYITLALLETPDSNVLGIARILSDTAFRQRVIKQIQDPVVKAFWTNEFKPSDPQLSNQAMIPILNKVGQFISNPIIRNMVGQRKNALDFEKFMTEGKIVIINLSKGKLGDENSALLGSLFITKIQQVALSRAKIPENERRDFYFYIDEFQNFATDAFTSILSEARKYHLNLTIAHQYMAQLPDEIKSTTFGNVGTIISFAVGGDDATYLSKEFAPVFDADDLINLNTREIYIKMTIDGKLTPPFSGYTLDTPKSTIDYSKEIIDASRLKYAQNRTRVENEIAQWTESNSASDSSTDDDSFPEPMI